MAYISISWSEHDVADRFIRPATDTLLCAPSPNRLARETKQVAVKFVAASQKNLDMRLTFVESVLGCFCVRLLRLGRGRTGGMVRPVLFWNRQEGATQAAVAGDTQAADQEGPLARAAGE